VLFRSAEYVAVVQIIIYAGAVTVLLLFAIMLTKRKIIEDKTDEARANTFFEAIAAGFLLCLILISICAPMLSPEIYRVTLDKQLTTPGTIHDLGGLLFTSYALPFLMVGVLLAVAMLAGVFMAREKEDE
jgi:NADH-quinone oxidoreductase subunit J